MRTTVEDVHEGDGKNVWLLSAGQVGDMSIEGDALLLVSIDLSRHAGSTDLLSSSRLGDSHAHTQDGVGTKLGLVLGPIELVEELVNLRLVLDIKALLHERRSDDIVNVADGLGNT